MWGKQWLWGMVIFCWSDFVKLVNISCLFMSQNAIRGKKEENKKSRKRAKKKRKRKRTKKNKEKNKGRKRRKEKKKKKRRKPVNKIFVYFSIVVKFLRVRACAVCVHHPRAYACMRVCVIADCLFC